MKICGVAGAVAIIRRFIGEAAMDGVCKCGRIDCIGGRRGAVRCGSVLERIVDRTAEVGIG